ncbi:MAG: ACP S-malonyltransferase [Cyanobacteria bacterium P01_A01_bin.17]
MTKTAWVFPGQGSQALGMGLDLKETDHGQKRFQEAAEILGWSVFEVCKGDEERLSQTNYTQPCLYVISAILADLLQERGIKPMVVAGHSLGEYVALYVAGVFDFAAGLSLVKRRSELMSQASDGKMTALMGFDREQLDLHAQKIDDVVLANDNHSGQVVISGSPAAVDELLSNIKVKRAMTLKVGGAFHSPLMAAAAAEYKADLDAISFQSAQIPVISNVEPAPETDPDVLKDRLMKQITGPVRWRETCLQFNDLGIEQVMEVGPGKVLTGLAKRTCKGVGLVNVSSVADLPA